MNWHSPNKPLIIGHRGASAYLPENSLAAFMLAVEQGADGLEFDVQLSVDGWPVIIHDATVDRTTNGTGSVSKMTVAELQKLAMAEGQIIPTLDDLFEALGPRTLYNIEIKDYGWRDRGTETAVSERIIAHNLTQYCLISSFNPFSVYRARRALPKNTPVALIREANWLKHAHRFLATQADHPDRQLVDEAYMNWARQNNLQVNVWTVDDPEEAKRLAQLGVNAVITNKPDVIKGYLQ